MLSLKGKDRLKITSTQVSQSVISSNIFPQELWTLYQLMDQICTTNISPMLLLEHLLGSQPTAEDPEQTDLSWLPGLLVVLMSILFNN